MTRRRDPFRTFALVMATIFAACMLALVVAFHGPANAQACTSVWQLRVKDGQELKTFNTQALCHAAAKAQSRTEPVTYACPLYLACPANTKPPVVTPPVVVPPVVVPPVVVPPTPGWVQGRSTASVPALSPRPSRDADTLDPTFGQPIRRVTDKADGIGWPGRNDYSRRQAFNADNSLQLVWARDGFWWAYDANALRPVKRLAGLAGDAEPQWHPTDPDRLTYLPNNGAGMTVHELTVSTNTTRQVADLGPRLRARWPTAASAWTKSEGSPSADGRFYCLMVDSASWGPVGVITWDKQTDTILGWLPTTERPDHVSMSPSGKYCVVSSGSGTVAHTRDFSQKRVLLTTTQHSDIALMPDGSDAFVAVDYNANDGEVFYTSLDTGVRVKIEPSYFGDSSGRAFHFSAKAFKRPGWVLVSSQLATAGAAVRPLDAKLTLVELKPGGRWLNVAWHRAGFPKTDYYLFSPTPSISADGSRIAFNSSWGGTTDADLAVFQIRLPAVQ